MGEWGWTALLIKALVLGGVWGKARGVFLEELVFLKARESSLEEKRLHAFRVGSGKLQNCSGSPGSWGPLSLCL